MSSRVGEQRTVLEIERLRLEYPRPGGVQCVLDGVSLALERGECLALVGESGAGKSQLFLAVLGLLRRGARVTGRACFDSEELIGAPRAVLGRVRGLGIGMVFQDALTALTPHLTIGEQIAEPLVRVRGWSSGAARARALELLERVRIGDAERCMRQFPHQLSGGMRQRVLIAAALACEPPLLVADEPTTALDVTLQAQVLALLARLKREQGMTLVLITHDLAAAAGVADRIAVMQHGQIVEEGPTHSMLRAPRHATTRALLAAQRPRGLAPPPTAPRPPMPAESPPAPAPPALALTMHEVQVVYPIRRGPWRRPLQLKALCAVNLELARGAAVGIVGESGSGKTTLLRTALGLIPVAAGRVVVLGRPPEPHDRLHRRQLGRELQIIFQDPGASLDPHLMVEEIVAEPLEVHRPDLNRAERARAVAGILERVGLAQALRGRHPHELSGGQAQRVAIARAMVLEPQLLICDEPVSALDVCVQAQIIRLLADLKRDFGMALLLVSHNLGVVRELCERVLVLYLGRMMELAPTETLFATPAHPYTRELLAALPVPDPAAQRQRLAALPAEHAAVSPLEPPSGCVYRSRCPHALPPCAERVPSWESAGHPDRQVACHRWRDLERAASS